MEIVYRNLDEDDVIKNGCTNKSNEIIKQEFDEFRLVCDTTVLFEYFTKEELNRLRKIKNRGNINYIRNFNFHSDLILHVYFCDHFTFVIDMREWLNDDEIYHLFQHKQTDECFSLVDGKLVVYDPIENKDIIISGEEIRNSLFGRQQYILIDKQVSSKVKGYCAFYKHPGYLSKRMLCKHKCLEKKCDCFITNPNADLTGNIVNIEKEQERKNRKKQFQKLNKKYLNGEISKEEFSRLERLI